MLKFYCDDSGTHAQSDIAVAAGYIGNVAQWESFEKDWKAANDDEGFGVFHMSDFNAHARPFDTEEWYDENKRKRVLNRLICISGTRARYAFGVAVDKASYDQLISSHARLRDIYGKHHYTFAVQACLNAIRLWKRTYAPDERIKYIFDQMSQGKGEILTVFEGARKIPVDYGIEAGGYGFESKTEIWPLQAVDILAWHVFTHMRDVVLNGLPMRPAIRSLRRYPYRVQYFDVGALTELREKTLASLSIMIESSHANAKGQTAQ